MADILSLHPTQFAVGMRIVNDKQEEFDGLTRKEKKEYIAHKKRWVPVVVGPGGELYMIDRHHFTRMLWQAGETRAYVKIVKNWSDLTPAAFWTRMGNADWVYLLDHLGQGPHSPQLLPPDVRSLADDPYRALARAVREKGGYDKSALPYSEFEWAEYFRSRISIKKIREDFDGATIQALALAAKRLPKVACPEVLNTRGAKAARR